MIPQELSGVYMTFKIDHAKWMVAEELTELIHNIYEDKGAAVDAASVYSALERPKERSHGDYAIPCFRFTKQLGQAPQKISADIVAGVSNSNGIWISEAHAAGPFLNIKLSLGKLAEFLLQDIESLAYFDRFKQHDKERVMVEYSQPNTHKVFHVGHMRNVALGDSLGRLYEYCGYPVSMVNYLGDEGTHIAKCLWYIKKHGLAVPETGRGEWLGEMYSKACIELEDAGEDDSKENQRAISDVLREIESKQGETFDFWKNSRQWSVDDFEKIYEWIGARFDHWFSESEVSEDSQKIVDEFLEQGIFKVDDGAVGVDLKDDKLGFLLLRKRDGNTLYATKDLALARHKYDQFDIKKSIYVVGSEQNLHFKQVFKCLEKMGFPQAKDCFHLSYGMVVLPDGKMSSRKGNVVTFKELQERLSTEIGKLLEQYRGEWSDEEIASTNHKLAVGAIRYGMICSDPAKDIVFSIDDWISFNGNTGPYLMYSYARTRSILNKAKQQDFIRDEKVDYSLLSLEEERDLIRYMNDFNNVVEQSCQSNRISMLSHHLYDMCKAYNRFFANVSVLKADSDGLIHARLMLLSAFSIVLEKGLQILGITPPERM